MLTFLNPAYRKNLSVTELNDTLKRIEAKIDALSESGPGQASSQVLVSNRDRPGSSAQHVALSPRPISPMAAPTPSRLGSAQMRQELAIPERHCTAPQHLLSWPCSPLSLTELELRYPVDIEIRQVKMRKTTSPPRCLSQLPQANENWLSALSLSQLRILTGFYFTHFHPQFLILDEDGFYANHLNHALRTGFADNLDSCLVLLVLSLGSLAACHTGSREWSQSDSTDFTSNYEAGLGFFNLASDMFRDVEAADWGSVQCLLLLGACATIMILLPLPAKADDSWSQILVEFDFPPSGLSGLEGAVPLPLVPDSGIDPHRRDQQFFFLALIAMRRLLNRIHFHLYNQEEVVPPSPSVMLELQRQIEEWRACLPPALKFDDLSLLEEVQTQTALPGSIRSMQERMKGNLKARYHAAWTILYRSHLHRAVHAPDPTALSDEEVAGARTAINSAITGILHGGIMHEPPELLLFPMNSWRTYFIKRIPNQNFSEALLLPGWEAVHQMRDVAVKVASSHSPTVSKDYEILQLLERTGGQD
ncbi:hypothetical protein CPLU01_08144 [Colletotrichum plurivorum]|uniref:Xylanolytic transcriptional activator regulatory domain-containing protein n=1 Tax=Colletotrichum plurivorum TaxID=2175906 RepID=A0A8H6KDQ2_9PEZI|nr:hypothetical protein CPLU01_08144 [Colletotrichum plurivorum]